MMALQIKKRPGWQLRVYHDGRQQDSGLRILKVLDTLGVELVYVEPEKETAETCTMTDNANHTKHFWSLRALSDPTVQTAVVLDAATPFTLLRMIDLAQNLTKSNTEWAFWRNPHDYIEHGTPQMPFLGARRSPASDLVVTNLEQQFCSSEIMKNKTEWSHLDVMQFPIQSLFPLLKQQSMHAPGDEILGKDPMMQNATVNKSGTSLYFKWEDSAGVTQSEVVSHFNIPAWPRIDCKRAPKEVEECNGGKTELAILNFTAIMTAIPKTEDDWMSYCTTDVASEVELLKIDVLRGSLYSAMILASKLRQDGKSEEADTWLKTSKVVDRLTTKMNGGDGQATYNLAVLHHHGRGVEKDTEKAAELYLKAGSLNVHQGFFNMGLMCETGDGTPKDAARAAAFYGQAADYHGGAAFQLGGLYLSGELGEEQDIGMENGIKLYKWAAHQHENADAQYAMGEIYREGKYRIEKNDETALYYYTKAGKQGHPGGLRSVGLMYWEGRAGLQQDKKFAIFMFHKAAGKGDEPSKDLIAKLDAEDDAIRQERDKRAGFKSPHEYPEADLSAASFTRGEGPPPNIPGGSIRM